MYNVLEIEFDRYICQPILDFHRYKHVVFFIFIKSGSILCIFDLFSFLYCICICCFISVCSAYLKKSNLNLIIEFPEKFTVKVY